MLISLSERVQRSLTILLLGPGKSQMIVLVLFLGLMLALGTGCPPLSSDTQETIAKALKSTGCRGCENPGPEEGEGEGENPVEGEGETTQEGEVSAEGEGEIPAEGETPLEGEGETTPEGEVPAEGEGEIPAEGEILVEGEGEASPEGEAPAEGEGEIPAEGEIFVEGEGEASPEGEVPAEGEGEIPAEGEIPIEGEGEGEPLPVLDCPPDTVYAQPANETGATYYSSTSLDTALPFETLVVDLGADPSDPVDDIYLTNTLHTAHWWGVEIDDTGSSCQSEVGIYALSIFRWDAEQQVYLPVCEWNSLVPERTPANFTVAGVSGDLPVYSYTVSLDPPCESLNGQAVYINIRKLMPLEGETDICRFGWLTTVNEVVQGSLLVTEPEPIALENSFAFCLTGTVSENEGETVQMVNSMAGFFEMGRPYEWTDVWGTEGEAQVEPADESPVHSVYLNAYQIGKYEITNQEYCNVLNYALARGYLKNADGSPWVGTGEIYSGSNLYILMDTVRPECNIAYAEGTFSPKVRSGLPGATQYSMGNHPVVAVSWYGAAAFCNWLSEMEGLTSCYDMIQKDWPLKVSITMGSGYRLPTEAEWERTAAWDGSKHWMYGFSSDDLIGKNRCNYLMGTVINPLGLAENPVTSPVGWFNGANVSPNGGIPTTDSVSPLGAYDMSGNVWEWCQDWLAPYSADTQLNPKGSATGKNKVLRGGSFEDAFFDCRSANRDSRGPDKTPYMRGFRVVRAWQQSTAVPD